MIHHLLFDLMGMGVKSWEVPFHEFPKVQVGIVHNFLSKLFKEWFLEHLFLQGHEEVQIPHVPTLTGSIFNNPQSLLF